MRVAVADYGAGNLRSVCAALERAGARPHVTTRRQDVLEAPLAVVAGVGHLARAARGLAESALSDALRQRLAWGRPSLGICVGLQLFFGDSEEGGAGLGLLEGPVRRLHAERVPHMGWNTLQLTRTGSILEGLDGEDVYFAHSYAAVPADRRTVTACVDHGGPIVAAVEAGPLAGVQFHPERSGVVGARVLEGVLRWSRSA